MTNATGFGESNATAVNLLQTYCTYGGWWSSVVRIGEKFQIRADGCLHLRLENWCDWEKKMQWFCHWIWSQDCPNDQTPETEAVENCNPCNRKTTKRIDYIIRSGMGGFFLEYITRNQTKTQRRLKSSLIQNVSGETKIWKYPVKHKRNKYVKRSTWTSIFLWIKHIYIYT